MSQGEPRRAKVGSMGLRWSHVATDEDEMGWMNELGTSSHR